MTAWLLRAEQIENIVRGAYESAAQMVESFDEPIIAGAIRKAAALIVVAVPPEGGPLTVHFPKVFKAIQ